MRLSFTPCRCQASHPYRVPRSLWMHFFPARRLYQCSACDCRFLAVKKDMDAAKWAATTGAFKAPTAETSSLRQPG